MELGIKGGFFMSWPSFSLGDVDVRSRVSSVSSFT